MHWRKRDLWKAGIACAGILLLLVLMAWLPVSVAGAYERAPGFSGPGTVTVQTTPTVDATVTALTKEQLTEEVAQQQHTWENWLWSNAATILSSFLSTLVIVLGALFGLWRWRGDRRDAQDKELKDRQNEREKRAEERFQSAVTGLGDAKEGAKIGAAILLRTFLRPGYEQFYTQTFDLAVANLRPQRDSKPLQFQLWSSTQDADTSLPLTTLRQALIVVFKEALSLARSQEKRSPRSLDATGIQLDNADLRRADLEQVWMPQASLRGANLNGAKLIGASLWWADLSGAELAAADLSGANLSGANLSEAYLHEANFSKAILTRANLSGADFRGDDLITTNLEDAASLEDTDLRGVNGLPKEQLKACKAKGAIVDEVFTTSSSQLPVSSPLPSQSNDAQAPSALLAQESTSIPDTDGSSAASSKPGHES